jgi:hypothetical protein
MDFASNVEINKIPDLTRELFEHVLFDEQPLFISDEATIWDVSMSPTEDLIDRCSRYYGIAVKEDDLAQPLWKLLRQLNEDRLAMINSNQEETREFCCSDVRRAIQLAEIPVIFMPKFREYGLRILDGGSSILVIKFCPWCGQRLPESLRDIWFDKLEKMGVDPYGQKVPPEFSDERWYQDK